MSETQPASSSLIDWLKSKKANAANWTVSLSVHVLVLVVLAIFTIETETKARIANILSELVEDTTKEDFQEELLKDEDLKLEAPVGLTTSTTPGAVARGSSGGLGVTNPTQATSELAAAKQAIGNRKLVRPLAGATGNLGLGSNISGLKGVSELAGAGGDAGVMDRVTQEIVRQASKNKVVVAWIMDSSASLDERRQAIADRFDRIYKELGAMNLIENEAVLSTIVSVGQDTRFLIDKPTNNVTEIREAIKKVKDDKTGKENLFESVKQTALKYRRFQTGGRRTLMIVLLTDEIGDDVAAADEAVALLKRNEVPLYAMGPIATFARPVIHDHWVDKETGFHFWPPLTRGPYTRIDEVLRVPFVQQAYLSGFGPFAMTQVTRETGGIFFIYNDNRVQGPSYDPELLMRYKANYGTAKDYNDEVNESPFRKALLTIAEDGNKIWYAGWPYGWIHAKYLNRSIGERQETVARFTSFAKDALPRLEALENEYSKETSLRWRANFDFTFARLLQAKVRADEYNWACADMKANPRTLKNPKNNGWHYALVDQIRAGTKPGEPRAAAPSDAAEKKGAESKAAKKEDPPAQTNIRKTNPQETEAAKKMLERSKFHFRRLIDEHSGTPWAYAAQVEINIPVGVDWQEGFDPNFILDDDLERLKQLEEAKKRVPKK